LTSVFDRMRCDFIERLMLQYLKAVPVHIEANDGILESLMLWLLVVIVHFPILHRLSSVQLEFVKFQFMMIPSFKIHVKRRTHKK
jgi:hypothetical protein